MRRLLSSSLGAVGLLFLACGGNEPNPTNTPANTSGQTDAAAAVQQTARTEPPAKSGVERSALDPSTPACDDFYQYACGGWIKATEIPGDEASWYRSFSVIRDRNEEILKAILESLAKGEGVNDTAYGKALGDFYASCMDEAAIEKNGTKPLDPWLKDIDALKDPASVTRLLGKMQADGSGIVWDLSSGQDFGDATQVVGMFWQAGLGMPEREYYLDDSPKMKELRGKYETHVAAMMQLAGEPEAKAKASAKKVLEIETAMAKAWMSKEDRREPKKLNHKATRAELPKLAPGIDWDKWLEAAGAKNVSSFNVGMPDFMKAVGAMIGGKVAVADWKTYLRWQLYRTTADQLPKRFVDENFKWRQALMGAKELPPRWKRCVRTIDGAMGEALGQPFVKKTLGAEGKATVVSMVQTIEKVMGSNIQGLAWMDAETKKAAAEKLAKVGNKIAYPEKWRNYDALKIDREAYVLNAERAAAFEYKRQLDKIGKPVDRTEWLMSPPSVNAYYDPQMNEMVFPAGILQPPFYANAAPQATNFGGIGMVMGHELTHGFDDEGRQFDGEGNLRDWWSKTVDAEFDRRASCVKKQFDEYTVLDGVHVNGKLTLGENIADLGGVKLSYRAMLAAKEKSRGGSKAEFTPEQEFFLGFAQGWCGKMRDEALRHQVATNPHSPPNLRVNGPLSNLPEFAQAFSCKAAAKMVKKDRCEVW
jgi:endothelin-converting enzyme/putative endopeptidase